MKNIIHHFLLLTTIWSLTALAVLGQNCPVNTNVTTTTTPNGTTLSWDAVAGAMQYEIRYRQVGTSALSYTSSSTNSYTFTNLSTNVCYEYSVRTICDSSTIGSWLVPAQSFCVPGATGLCLLPTNITSTTTANTAQITWTASNNAQAYEIRYRLAGTYDPLTYVTTNTNSLSLSGLNPNTCYAYSIRTLCDSSNNSPWLSPGRQFCTTPLTQPCVLPTTINVATSAGAATLSWAGTNNAVGYEIRYRKAGTSALSYATTNTNSIALNNLMENVCYEYSIRTLCDSNATSPWMVPADSFCVPGATGVCLLPSNLNSTTTATTAQINWTGVSNAQGYEIRYRLAGTYDPLTYVTTSTNSLNLSGLTPNTCYAYSIRTLCDSSNASSWLSPGRQFCTTPLAQSCALPTNISASTSPGAVLLSWAGPNNAVGYEIRYRLVGTSALSYVTSNTNRVNINNLLENRCYEYSIRTLCDSNATSPWLVPAQQFCVPGANGLCLLPENINATTTSSTAQINWTAAAGAQGYEIRYRLAGTYDPLTYATTSTNSLSLSGLTPNTCYAYSIRTICDSSSFSPWLVPAQQFCTGMPNNPCNTPTNITSSTTSNAATISWTSSSSSSSNAFGYEVRYRAIGTSALSYASTSTTSITLGNLMPNTCYEFSVRTECDTNYYSPWLVPAQQFCTDSVVIPPCNRVTNVNADSIGTNSAWITWTSNNSAVFGYEVRYKAFNEVNYTVIQTPSPAAFLANLQSATCYNYEVRTICDTMHNSYSGWSSNNNFFCTDTLACPMPMNIREDSVTNNMVMLSWNGNASFGYEVRYKLFYSNSFTTVMTNIPSITIGNLAADSCYIYSIRAICDTVPSNYSAWTNEDLFCAASNPMICAVPNNIVVDTVGNNFAFFYWDSVMNANYYHVRFRQANSNMPYMYDTTFFNNYGNYNLAANTCYEFQFQSYCPNSANGWSNWSTSITICTDSISFNCARPTNTFTVMNPTFGSFNWNRIMGAFAYEVRFRPLGSNMPYTTLYSSDTTEFYQGFQAGTCYEYNVRTQCDTFLSPTGQYTYSFWSIQDTFCTPSLLVQGSEEQSTTVDNFHSLESTPIHYSLFPNPTTGQVTLKFEQSMMTDYTVRVFNVLGAEVTPSNLRSGEETCTLNLSALSNGLYLIEVSTAQQSHTEQIQVYK